MRCDVPRNVAGLTRWAFRRSVRWLSRVLSKRDHVLLLTEQPELFLGRVHSLCHALNTAQNAAYLPASGPVVLWYRRTGQTGADFVHGEEREQMVEEHMLMVI